MISKFSILFLLLFAGGIYSLVFVAPVWGFYVYEMLYFLNPTNRWWGAGIPNISYSFITVLLTLVFLFFKRKEITDNTINKIPEFKWFILLYLVYIMVTFFAVSIELHNKYMLALLKQLLVMYIAYRLLDSEKKLTLAIYFYLLGCGYIGYEAFLRGRDMFGRVEGIGTLDAPGANGISAAIAPAIPLLIYFFWRANIKIKIAALLLGVFIANGLILINSRGAFLGAAVGLAYLVFFIAFSKFKLPKQRIALVVLIIIGVSGVVRFTDDMFWSRMSTITSSSIENENESGAGRVQFWMKTFDMLDEQPMGLGIWGYQLMSPLYLSEVQIEHAKREGWTGRAVHSMWFQGLSEIGYLGMLIFFALLISTKMHVNRAKKHVISHGDYNFYYLLISIEAALISFLVAGSFIDAFRAEILYWLLMFCIVSSTVALNKFSSSDSVKQLNKSSNDIDTHSRLGNTND